MKKVFFYVLTITLLLFTSCKNEDVINPRKAVTAADFLELYNQDADFLRKALKKYKIDEDNVSNDGENYWVIKEKNWDIYITCDGYDAFVKFNMENNKCTRVSILYSGTDFSYGALNGIREKFGESSEIFPYIYEWFLSDNSCITYYSGSSLHIHREKVADNNTPTQELQKEIIIKSTLERGVN